MRNLHMNTLRFRRIWCTDNLIPRAERVRTSPAVQDSTARPLARLHPQTQDGAACCSEAAPTELTGASVAESARSSQAGHDEVALARIAGSVTEPPSQVGGAPACTPTAGAYVAGLPPTPSLLLVVCIRFGGSAAPSPS